MPVILSDEELQSVRLTEKEARLELAVALFAQDRATLAQAARLAGLPFLDFQRELGRRKIPIHYGKEQLEADMRRLGLTVA